MSKSKSKETKEVQEESTTGNDQIVSAVNFLHDTFKDAHANKINKKILAHVQELMGLVKEL